MIDFLIFTGVVCACFAALGFFEWLAKKLFGSKWGE